MFWQICEKFFKYFTTVLQRFGLPPSQSGVWSYKILGFFDDDNFQDNEEDKPGSKIMFFYDEEQMQEVNHVSVTVMTMLLMMEMMPMWGWSGKCQ